MKLIHTKIRLSEQQRKNLKKLRDYLWALPLRYDHFSMDRYFAHRSQEMFDYEEVADIFENHICGTVACALGHGPAAGIKPRGLTSMVGTRLWTTYGDRAFGAGADSSPLLWSFLFSGRWREVDNTPHGAADRIHYFLKNGIPAHESSAFLTYRDMDRAKRLYSLDPEDRPVQPKVEAVA